MKRAAALAVALVLAAGVAWLVTRDGTPPGAAVCAEVERRLQSGDVPGAEKVLRTARDRLPAHVSGYLDALLALTAGKDEEALAAAEAAVVASSAAKDDWRTVSVLFFARLNTGRAAVAWEGLDAYVTAHPEDERGLAAAAQYWIEARPVDPDPERARAFLDRIEALPSRTVPPGDPTAVRPEELARLRARVEQIRGRIGSAVAAAEERVKAVPEDPDARAQLGEAYRVARRLADARQAFRDAVRLAPGNAVYAKQLALLLLETDDTGPEVDPLTLRIVEWAPEDPEAHVLRARALVRNRQIDEAIDTYRWLLGPPVGTKLTKRQRAEVCRNLAVALYDWEQGGQDGDYLDEAHTLLVEYRQLGGEIDLRLADVWGRLEARAKAKSAVPR